MDVDPQFFVRYGDIHIVLATVKGSRERGLAVRQYAEKQGLTTRAVRWRVGQIEAHGSEALKKHRRSDAGGYHIPQLSMQVIAAAWMSNPATTSSRMLQRTLVRAVPEAMQVTRRSGKTSFITAATVNRVKRHLQNNPLTRLMFTNTDEQKEYMRTCSGEVVALHTNQLWPQGARLDLQTVQPRLTKAFRHALGRMDYAVQRKSPLALLVGAHGGGKTTAARVFAASRKDALLWEAPPGYDERRLMADLCLKLGITAGEGYHVRTQVVVDHLTEHPRVLMIDEAQRLNYRVLDLLKYLADKSRSTVILIGSPWLEQQIERRTDISSRVWVRARVEPLGLDEFRELYASEGYAPAVLDELHALTGGVLRVLTALLTHLEAALAHQKVLSRETLTVAHVRLAAEVVL